MPNGIQYYNAVDDMSPEEKYYKEQMKYAIDTGNSGMAANVAGQAGGMPMAYSSMEQLGAQDPNNQQYQAYSKEKTNYNDFVGTLPEKWQKDFFSQYIPQYDKEMKNVRFNKNADGTYTALKSADFGGGSYEDQVNWLKNNPVTDNWFKWTVDPNDVSKAGATYEQYDAPGTQGNSYAPYFLAAGTLLTGGLLAPVMAGAGLAGGAAIGAGLGGANAAIGSSIANPGGGPDWGKVAMGAGTGALGGGFAGAGGFSGLSNSLGGGGEFVMNPDTAAAYAMESYPSGWEGSIYGSPEGLMDATGSLEGLVGSDYGEYATDSEGEAFNYEPAPGEDALSQKISGMDMKNLVKKVGLNAAKQLLAPKSQSSQPAQAASASGSGALIASLQGGAQSSARSSAPVIDQQMLAYKQAQLDPEYWRFMSTDEGGI